MLATDSALAFSQLDVGYGNRRKFSANPAFGRRHPDLGVEAHTFQYSWWLGHSSAQFPTPRGWPAQDVAADHQGRHGCVGHAPLAESGGKLNSFPASWQPPDERHMVVGLVILRRPRVGQFGAREMPGRPVHQVFNQT